jgi:hypothetical protein
MSSRGNAGRQKGSFSTDCRTGQQMTKNHVVHRVWYGAIHDLRFWALEIAVGAIGLALSY